MSNLSFLSEWPELQARTKGTGTLVDVGQFSNLVHQMKLNVIGAKR